LIEMRWSFLIITV